MGYRIRLAFLKFMVWWLKPTPEQHRAVMNKLEEEGKLR